MSEIINFNAWSLHKIIANLENVLFWSEIIAI